MILVEAWVVTDTSIDDEDDRMMVRIPLILTQEFNVDKFSELRLMVYT